MFIADLHCDLLSFLAKNSSFTTDMTSSRCCYLQMKQGGVCLQTLAIFAQNKKGSFLEGKKQIQILDQLLQSTPDRYRLWDPTLCFLSNNPPINVLIAFENASSFAEEDTPLDNSFQFLEDVLLRFKKILSISLTWDGENRFGGGAFSNIGLKEDGKRLLEWMDKKNIALDFSHTSDYLAGDLFDYIEKKSLQIPVLASHSNARPVTKRERNLPLFAIQEILARKGLIGLNFFAPFIGKKIQDLALHVEYFLKLGAENNLCFGADFFYEPDLSYLATKYQTTTDFFPELANSSCYPLALSLLQNELGLSLAQLNKISHQNIQNYLTLAP